MNRIAFSIFAINVYWYSVCILLGIVIAYSLIAYEAKKHGISKDVVSNLMFYTILIGIVGARIYYVIFNLNYYLKNPIEILKIYNGGLAIHGGILFGLIFVYFYAKKKKFNFIRILDIVSPALIIAQAVGRWGNFFNQEAYGREVTLQTLQGFHIPDFIIKGMKINGSYYYPCFLYESLLCLIGFIIIMLIRKKKNIKLGTQIGFYFIWYGITRFFIEASRQDSLMLFNLKMAQIISIIGIVIGMMLIIRKSGKYYEE